ncbi:hydrolase 1, exosortase A system-associated [Novosphingobium sp. FSY-8]|uniref:Hydrolase 1, exosortase A system-associated n=2 Tax=Novosphingobium ovatum TaxID=1908523 RepID=A0ABW9XC25_9SPHN|nr:hydrolase 1, exosortase A system-associated [Novosphingobium ovatum]
MRKGIAFTCEAAALFGTLDLPADGAPRAGLLLVSGGNEIRAGAWSGQAQMAARLAAQGFAVMRYDRRGVGDSEGMNTGFRGSGPDILAALTAFRDAVPGLARLVVLGNCDAASAVMMTAPQMQGVSALVLSNPWTIEQDEDGAAEEKAAMPTAALRAHYRARLANPAMLLRLLTGKVSIFGAIRSVIAMLRPKPAEPNPLARAMAEGLSAWGGPAMLLIAGRDRTGLAFLDNWDKRDRRIQTCDGATHSFVEDHARDWYLAQVVVALNG